MVNLLLKKVKYFLMNSVLPECVVFVKSTALCSNVRGLHIHWPLTHAEHGSMLHGFGAWEQ